VKYPSRPLENWSWAKELRRRHYEELMTAKERGLLVVTGSGHAPKELVYGVTDFAYLAGEPWGASIATDPDMALRCAEAAESLGFARDLCAYMRLYWGSMILNLSPWGGFPRPDFAIQSALCDSHGKWYQMVSEYLNIPFFFTEVPHDGRPYEPAEHSLDYLTQQFQELIEKVENFTGRKCDEERLIEAVVNMWNTRVLWAEIMELNQAVPAPLEIKSMFSLYVPAEVEPYKRETVEFYRALKDEVAQRVKEGVAAVENESCRLLHEGQPPWYALHILRHMQRRYGVAFVGGMYVFFLTGLWEVTDEGIRPRRPITPENRPRSREEAVRLRALIDSLSLKFIVDLKTKQRILEELVRRWKCQGVMFHLNRGCEGMALHEMALRTMLQRQGIPTMIYEGNMADRREWSEVQTLERAESFLESLGVK